MVASHPAGRPSRRSTSPTPPARRSGAGAIADRDPPPAGPRGAGRAGRAAPCASPAGVPGGVGERRLPSIFRSTDLTPLVLLISLADRGRLGAGHALTPGHGKTLMAAYLVGTRGTPLHAAGLGLSVTLSHTLGILVLAALVVGAAGRPAAGRRRSLGAGRRGGLDRRHRRLDAARRGPTPAPARGRAAAARRTPTTSTTHEHDHAHDHRATTRARPRPAHDHDPRRAGEHSHGGVRHSHLPPAGTTITWRSLFVLGLAGGLIPSTSALLILLGSIAAGRPAFGFVLVVAFGLGMAAGHGRDRRSRSSSRAVGSIAWTPASALGRVDGLVPLAAASWCSGSGCTSRSRPSARRHDSSE